MAIHRRPVNLLAKPAFTRNAFRQFILPNRWICDSCGKPIDRPEAGWIEWLTILDDEALESVDLQPRIVHHNTKCQYKDTSLPIPNTRIGDVPLKEYQAKSMFWLLLDHGDAKGNRPSPEFIRIVWRLIIHDFDFGNREILESIADNTSR